MPNISAVEYLRLKQAESRLNDLHTSQVLKEPCEKFGQLLAMTLAFTPYSQWTTREKAALSHALGTLKQLYIERLPSD